MKASKPPKYELFQTVYFINNTIKTLLITGIDAEGYVSSDEFWVHSYKYFYGANYERITKDESELFASKDEAIKFLSK